MPDWSDEGIVLSARSYGETDMIINVLTPSQGRYAGLVRGGQSRKSRGVLQLGNKLDLNWRGRNAESLGAFTVDMISPYGSLFFDDSLRLCGLSAACALLESCVPEREPVLPIYRAASALISMIADVDLGDAWLGGYVRWELGMLEAAGYGLEFDRCGVSGAESDLEFVSPRTGVAVTRAAAGVHISRLLPLPQFLGGGVADKPIEQDLLDGLSLTGHFLSRRIFDLHNKPLPPPRVRLMALAEAALGRSCDKSFLHHCD